MITAFKNKSFPRWIQIFAFGELIEEIEGKKKALRAGKKLARKHKLDYVYFLDNIISVE